MLKRACSPILFGGISQKPYKITVSKGDVVNTRNRCEMCLACFSSAAEFLNEGQKAWNSCHTPRTRAAVMFRKVNLFFSLPPLNAPRPLSGFDTHPRWLPVTHSARSRPSYGKIGDCEQSRILHFWNYFVVEVLASCYRFSVGEKTRLAL